MDYWDRLKHYRLYSLERRRERYCIIYIWKILEGLVPNPNIRSYDAGRRGRLCAIPPMNNKAPKWTQNLREASFGVRAARLFNCIPCHIRDLTGCNVDKFKKDLDDWLKNIPDEPLVKGYTARRRCESNSIRHMAVFEAARPGHLWGY